MLCSSSGCRARPRPFLLGDGVTVRERVFTGELAAQLSAPGTNPQDAGSAFSLCCVALRQLEDGFPRG